MDTAWARVNLSAVDILPMANVQDEDSDFLIQNVTDDSVVAHAVSPKAAFFTVKWLTKLPWVFSSREAISQEAIDGSLAIRVQFGNLLLGRAGEFNPPSQAAAPVLRA